jgi:lactoylglutathione lyase/glyoxylase I family protein
MVTNIAHICFTVSDLEKSLAFWRDLGFPEAFEFRDEERGKFGAYVHVGGRNFIEMFTGELSENGGTGAYRHLCLEVDDIEATKREFQGKGITVTDIKLGNDQSYQAWIRDPDGNRIELHQYTDNSKQGPWVT